MDEMGCIQRKIKITNFVSQPSFPEMAVRDTRIHTNLLNWKATTNVLQNLQVSPSQMRSPFFTRGLFIGVFNFSNYILMNISRRSK
jgi:hypothetical protein